MQDIWLHTTGHTVRSESDTEGISTSVETPTQWRNKYQDQWQHQLRQAVIYYD